MTAQYPNPIALSVVKQPQLPVEEQMKNLYADFLDVFNVYIQKILLKYSVTPSDYRAMDPAYIDFFINYFGLQSLRLSEVGYTDQQIKTIISNATVIYNTQGSYYCLKYFYQILQGIYDDNFQNQIFYFDGNKEYDGSFVFGYNNTNEGVPISFISGTFIINAQVNDLVFKLLQKFKSARDKLNLIP